LLVGCDFSFLRDEDSNRHAHFSTDLRLTRVRPRL
jgi:hypothetical protein